MARQRVEALATHLMQRRWDVIVIGCGAMGAATCAQLARRGKRVLGLEQFTRGHDRGSSHGGSRVVRESYFEHRAYVPLLNRARELWSDLEELSQQQLVHRCGVLYAGDPVGEVMRGIRASATHYEIPVSALTPSEVETRFPMFAIPEKFESLLEPGGGFVRPERAVRAFLHLAEGHGATILEGERVERIEGRGRSTIVESVAGEYEAETVVITGGAWTSQLVPELRNMLRPTRQVIAWIDPGPHAAAADEKHCPVWFIEDGDRGPFYGIPIGADQEPPFGVKISRHLPGETVDPDAPRRGGSETEIRDLVDAMARLLPGVAGPSCAEATCMYTMTPDSHFIIDRVPGMRRVLIACGFSGHGFKFAPVIGEILADLAIEGSTRHSIDFLKLERGIADPAEHP